MVMVLLLVQHVCCLTRLFAQWRLLQTFEGEVELGSRCGWLLGGFLLWVRGGGTWLVKAFYSVPKVVSLAPSLAQLEREATFSRLLLSFLFW
jgi:hypothetical protein